MVTVSNKIINIYYLIGFKDKTQYIQIRPILVNILCLALCSNTFMYIVFNKDANHYDGNNHNNIIKSLLAAKDVDVLLTIFGFSMEYMFISKNMMTLMKIIDKEFHKYESTFGIKQKDFVVQGKKDQFDLLQKTSLLLVIIVSILIFLPSVVTMYLVYSNGMSNIKVRDLPLPIVFWYPPEYDLIQVYILAYILQATYLVHLLGHIYLVYGSVISSIQSLIIDIDLLCMDIKDIDSMLLKCQDENMESKYLRKYLNYLIVCHQSILRNVKLFNRCVSLMTTLGNQCICFQVCVFLYCITEIDNKFAKFGYFSIALSEASVLFIYCYNGQKIINGNENIRRHFYHCSWLSKPMWFKKDLMIMMALADAPLQVKPFGLYILNLNNFSSIMNAAYSYFNMLRTFHK